VIEVKYTGITTQAGEPLSLDTSQILHQHLSESETLLAELIKGLLESSTPCKDCFQLQVVKI